MILSAIFRMESQVVQVVRVAPQPLPQLQVQPQALELVQAPEVLVLPQRPQLVRQLELAPQLGLVQMRLMELQQLRQGYR